MNIQQIAERIRDGIICDSEAVTLAKAYLALTSMRTTRGSEYEMHIESLMAAAHCTREEALEVDISAWRYAESLAKLGNMKGAEK